MDAIGWFIATLHQVLGHAKAAAVIGSPPGDSSQCVICAFEADPTDERRAAVEEALKPTPPRPVEDVALPGDT
jgi:hypothetical protein